LDHPQVASERLCRLLDTRPDESNQYGDAYYAILALGARGDLQAKAAVRRYLARNTVQSCRTVCYALRSTRPEWALELLTPLLQDHRVAYEGEHETRFVADEAAETIRLARLAPPTGYL
jgi:hypothetical protein